MNLLEQKKQLRVELKKRRSVLTQTDVAEKSLQIHENLQKIAAFKQAESFFCFISYQKEVDTHALIKSFLEQNLSLAVPKIMGKEEMIAVPFTSWEELEPDKMGILTPKSNELALGPFDVTITPGLGFTPCGDRLGYGRGYYDRWFANYDVKTRIGVAFEVQVVEELPLEKTDMPLDMLVTEERIIDLRNTR